MSSLKIGAVLVALLALSACNAIAFNRSLARSTFRCAKLAPHDVELSSGRMHYWEGGNPTGPTLVLVHGFGFGALETWEGQVPTLARRFHIIAPDLYWFGQSTPNNAADTAADQAHAIDELLGKLGVARADVVGTSFGGYVAIELALAHPDRVGRLVLVDAAGITPTPEEAELILANFGHVTSVRDIMIPGSVEALRAILRRLFYRPRWIPGWVLRQILEQEFWRFRQEKARILDKLVAPGGLHEVEHLAAIVAPTLVIWGRHDPIILPSMGERMARSIPRARLLWMERSNHAAMLEEPGRFNDAVLRFLTDGK